jgi:hypothetical protein
LLCGLLVTDEPKKLVEQVVSAGYGYFDALLRGYRLSRNLKFSKTAHAKTPVLRAIKIGDRDTMLGKLSAQA